MVNKIKKEKTKYIIGIIFMFISAIIITSVFWANKTFSVTSLSQIIFLIKAPITGTDSGIFLSWILWSGLPSIIATLLGTLIIFNAYRFFKKEKTKTIIRVTIDKYFAFVMVLCLIASIALASINYDVNGYFNNIIQTTSIYEDYYVNPSNANITFPQEKRNIIHIYLESIESTYVDSHNGGGMKSNYIPELQLLAQDNINFSANQNVGGSQTIVGTQWTIAAMVSQSAGIPLSIPLEGNSYGGNTQFLPGSYTLGQMLEKQGYTNEIMLGSDASFAGTSNFYKQHGNYNIVDYKEIKKQQRIPSDYYQFWGIEDQKLLAFAKEDILQLTTTNKPFNFELATIDSHTPEGYCCSLCPTTYPTQYENVIACQSKQISDFVKWAKQQSFYDNTTIIITGDHISMATEFFKDISPDYMRTPYNVVINSAVTSNNIKNRNFTSVDWYPTILASIGVTIEGDRLGLGTNLFSDRQTLVEELGFDVLNSEIQKTSTFYNENILAIQ